MFRPLLLTVIGLLLLTGLHAADKDKAYPKPPKPSDAEPLTKHLSVAKAATLLDTVGVNWTRERNCGTCHTNYPFLVARPVLREALKEEKAPAYDEVRGWFEKRVANWDRGKKGDKAFADAEVVATAATLALADARSTGKLQPLTRKALDRIWTIQQKNGAWNWLKCNWPPLEHDDYFGAVYAAVAVGEAPDQYAKTDRAVAGLEKLRAYLKATPPPDLHHKAMLLWASVRLDGLLTDEGKAAAVKELLAAQGGDGGWNLPTLGKWDRRDGTPNVAGSGSDGYATGLVVFVLRQAGVAASDARIQKGVQWLRSNQRESGRWFTRSVNTDNAHFISNAGTCYAILALHACDALKP